MLAVGLARRITQLKKSDCLDALQHFWSGHATTHVSERYTKLIEDRDYRLEWAEKIGMGFELPAVSVAPRPHLSYSKGELSSLESGG
jgi:hypothetical protein